MVMPFSICLVLAIPALLAGPAVSRAPVCGLAPRFTSRSGTIRCTAAGWMTLSTRSPALHNGTREGWAVHAELKVLTDVPAETPLPIVLNIIDPDNFPTMSSARKALRRGSVIVNGAEARCISTASPGDVISLQSRRTPGFTPRGRPPPFDVQVIYEDDAMAVVNKPAGVCTHPPPGGSQSMSMRTAIQHALRPPPEGTPSALYRPQCVHRLDKATSGLLVCAKTKPALLSLQASFRERSVSKTYAAIVCGAVEGDEGWIDEPIDGRSAQTRWQVVRRARSLKLGGGHLTHLALYPRTGRTHQLRKHCSLVLQCPIVGDKAYGGDDAGSGMYLVALELSLPHPDSAEDDPETLNVALSPPAKFEKLLVREQLRWEQLSVPEQAIAGSACKQLTKNAL